MATADPSGASKPSGKRNWLRKPAWLLEKQEELKQQEEDIFRRSRDCHADILAEQEQRRRRKEEKAERQRKDEIEKQKEREAKRRRVMEEKKEEARRELAEERAKDDALRDPNISSEKSEAPKVESTLSQPESGRAVGVVVEIIDSEDESSQLRRYRPSASQNSNRPSIARASSTSSNPDVGRTSFESRNKSFNGRVMQDSDDESFGDKARHGQRDVSDGGQCNEQSRSPQLGSARGRDATSPDNPTAEALPKIVDNGPNPPIFILIDPRIPGTKQLLVKRYYRDNLKVVRKTWCEKQGFTPEMTKSVILTWRGRRAFDVANCKSLGIELDDYGEPIIRAGQKGYDESGSKIVLEATTEELLEQDRKAAAEAARPKAEEGLDSPHQQETFIRVFLRAKGLTELRLKVKPVYWLTKHVFYLQRKR